MNKHLRVVKYVAFAAAAGTLAYFIWQQTRKQTVPPVEISPRKSVSKSRAAKQINLARASRQDVMDLLRDIWQVQKEIAQLIEKAVVELLAKDLDIVQVYELILKNQPEDPLEAHGLSIPDFDALLERFEKDQEVHNMIIDVIQGPDSRPTSTSSEKLRELTPDLLIEINKAMRDRLRSAVDELTRRTSELPGPYNPRTASLTCQTIVGGFVQSEFGVASDEVERAMSLHQYELAHREDFIAINDEIQQLMNAFIKHST